MGQNLGAPIDGATKTIKVRSDEHDGDVVRINADDFDERVHTRIASKKEKLRVDKDKKVKSNKKVKREKLDPSAHREEADTSTDAAKADEEAGDKKKK